MEISQGSMVYMKIEVRGQEPVFRDGYFSHPGHVFTLGCERGSLMRVYMKKIFI